ncbi:MAG TPA: rhodanese-like domain-containing protein [Kofleriaceae bacterium]|nr:rhodanese-like domain-containing protein [Kofleriaceae bacterium]
MAIKRVAPPEAADLLQQGWTYVDVRSIPEFEEGHPAGAYNVPFLHRGPSGMSPNPDFLAVMTRAFSPDRTLVLGCRSGNRSLRAAELLVQHGYRQIVEMRGGYLGETGPGGATVCEGWKTLGLPSATAAEPGRAYHDLKENE